MGQVSDSFYADVLTAISAPTTATTLALCHAWQACEGGTASFNPWNTTWREGDASEYNSAGVENYVDQAEGVHATVATLGQPEYEAIRLALREQDAHSFGDAVDSSLWGTQGVAAYLAQHPAPAPGSPTPPPQGDIVSQLPTLGEGAGVPPKLENPHVRNVQALLTGHGYTLSMDGEFGPTTASYVRSFQSARGLAVDGIVGPHTWAALLDV